MMLKFLTTAITRDPIGKVFSSTSIAILNETFSVIFKHCVDDVRFTLLDFLTDLCVDFGVLNMKKNSLKNS